MILMLVKRLQEDLMVQVWMTSLEMLRKIKILKFTSLLVSLMKSTQRLSLKFTTTTFY